jgi:hypothetical protein
MLEVRSLAAVVLNPLTETAPGRAIPLHRVCRVVRNRKIGDQWAVWRMVGVFDPGHVGYGPLLDVQETVDALDAVSVSGVEESCVSKTASSRVL